MSGRWKINMDDPRYVVGDEEQRVEGSVALIREKRPDATLTECGGRGICPSFR